MEFAQNLKIVNGKILTPSGIIPGGTVLIIEGAIAAISDRDIEFEAAIEIDAKGKYVSPGFIDIHVHGGGGHDFMDASETAFLKIAETHVRYGTTAMVPTTLTGSKEEILETLAVYEKVNHKNIHGAQFLGMHLEGPYFAMNQRGAQDPRFIRNPDPQEYKDILSQVSCIKRWSAAPELEGAIEFGRYIKSHGVLPALAHTDAVYEEVIKAFDNGYTLATHLYSGMSGVTRRNAYRYAGVIESAFLIDEMDVEVIADGAHLPAPLLKLIFKIKGADRIALITDAMRAAGTDVSESILGNEHIGLKVIVEDGVAKLPDRTSFAGSVATTDRLVRTMIALAGVSVADAVKMMSATPARIMGVLDRKGEIAVGKDADIVIFDEGISVETTIVNGRVLFQKL
ncbi:N-acetylglucosamine-6-phosphate deacetylase [Flavihumibacter profundi]|uniref:N-acetylglucosamine-6-phosphate deacetylase n=1 Tax=Flavihumibacter profundi TaxID=2716883 RepID=UPI001CC3A8A9|nr:N-acetylglucosamine-6-phosphate deacetylase [Flavihumibacter profundi]MBZ5858264.1 N-acetylglucosamine-6-phosphate deacetylase [Flavihumibacter profundi]